MAVQNNQKVNRQKSRRKRSVLQYHKKSMLLISIILMLLTGTVTVSAVSLEEKNRDYKKQEEELEAQILEEKDRSERIEEYREYVKTDDYVKDIAEEKLGLVDPNEIIFKSTQ